MEKIVLAAEPRQETGKGAARRLRAEGRLPAVLYGHKQEPMLLSVDAKAFSEAHAQGGGNAILTLKLPGKGKSYDTLVKDVESERVRRTPLHVDFQMAYMDEKIKTTVPIHLTGEAPGIKAGGVLQHSLREIEVEALPQDLPDVVEVDLSNLNMGDSLLVKDLPLPESVHVLTDGDTAIASIVVLRAAASVQAALEEGAPETAAEEPGA